MDFEGLIEKYQKSKLNHSLDTGECIALMRQFVQEKDEEILYARFAYYEGENLYYEGKMDEALNILKEHSLPTLKKKKYYKEIVLAYNLVAIILQTQYEYLDAVDFYMYALDLAIDHEEYILIGNIYNNLSNVFEDCEDYDRQLEYLHLSVEAYEKVDISNQRKMVTYVNLATTYCRVGDFKKAEQYYQEIISIYDKEKDGSFYMNLLVLECSIAFYKQDKRLCTEILNQILVLVNQGNLNVDNFKEVIHLVSTTSFFVDREIVGNMFEELKRCVTQLGYIDFELYLKEMMIQYFYQIGDSEKTKELALRYFELSRIKDCRSKKIMLDSVDNKFKMYQLTKDSITARANLINLKVKSEMDPLTRLLNRSALESIVEEWFQEAIDNQYPMAVEIVDVDYFKQFNDTYGHVRGDETLKALAEIMNRMQGDNLLFIRYGGDEFLAFYLNHSQEKVISLAKLLKSEIRALNIDHASTLLEEKKLSVTQGIHYGIPNKGDNMYDFIRKCDDSLYKGKVTRSAIIFNEKQYF